MKKICVLLTLILISLSLIKIAYADETILLPDDGGGGAPIVKAKWEMNGLAADLLGTDDDTAPGAQLKAPGVWDGSINYSLCAVVTDPDGTDDINAVYADIYYPSDRAFHPMDPNQPDQINGGTAATPDYGLSGCGSQVGDETQLRQLDKTAGYELFCQQIINNNQNLPSFYDVYDFNEICAPDGELQKETAFVYCSDRSLRWEDPAGDYLVKISAMDNSGVFSNILENHFTYLPLTAYEVDFSAVSYGNVKLNVQKLISGDLTFLPSDDKPTVRNLGNTRLTLGVSQDDMGLGTTDSAWNVEYDARVGNNEADWKVYPPEQLTWLEDILDLSETEEMDFSILVTKFPSPTTDYHGTLILDAKQASFRQCRGG